MLNFQAMQLLHRHGEDWGQMEELEHHSPATHDPERRLLRGDRVYRCKTCADEVRIVVPSEET